MHETGAVNTMNKTLASPLLLSLLATTLVAGCASAPRLDRNLERIGFSGPNTPSASVDGDDMFRRIGAEPTNARLHFDNGRFLRSEEHTSALQSLMRISYAVYCLKQTTATHIRTTHRH